MSLSNLMLLVLTVSLHFLRSHFCFYFFTLGFGFIPPVCAAAPFASCAAVRTSSNLSAASRRMIFHQPTRLLPPSTMGLVWYRNRKPKLTTKEAPLLFIPGDPDSRVHPHASGGSCPEPQRLSFRAASSIMSMAAPNA